MFEKIYDEDFTTLMNDNISEDLGLLNTWISDGSRDLSNYWICSKSDAYMPEGALLLNIADMMKDVRCKSTEAHIIYTKPLIL